MGFKIGGFGGGKTTMPPPDLSGKGRQDIGPNGPRTNTTTPGGNITNNSTSLNNGRGVDGKNGKGGKLGGNLLDFGLNAGGGALGLTGSGLTGGTGATANNLYSTTAQPSAIRAEACSHRAAKAAASDRCCNSC
ncbi:hypothetical protein IE994_23170 [Enterobacter hormaechei]|nr:hypothetical protein [Enterobacter hormaechei]